VHGKEKKKNQLFRVSKPWRNYGTAIEIKTLVNRISCSFFPSGRRHTAVRPRRPGHVEITVLYWDFVKTDKEQKKKKKQ
jgi:hypothetical protein